MTVYRCARCRAYVVKSQLEWESPRRWVCKNLERCLHGQRVNIYISRIVREGKKQSVRLR